MVLLQVEKLTKDWTIHSAYIDFVSYVLYVLLTAHMLGCLFFLWPEIFIDPVCNGPCHCGYEEEHVVLKNKEGGLEDGCGVGCFCNGTITFPDSWRTDYGLDGGIDEEALAPAVQYALSAYWSITTMTTIGYGDISPSLKQPAEVVFVTFAEVLGMVRAR